MILRSPPLIDGMNLVAKEYVAVQQARHGGGKLVLSEFTGAAAEIREAVMCNPFGVGGLSQRVEHAIGLPAGAGRAAIAAMAPRVRTHDVHRWADEQLAVISSRSNSTWAPRGTRQPRRATGYLAGPQARPAKAQRGPATNQWWR
jgi:trehalose 6-phosphate synthase